MQMWKDVLDFHDALDIPITCVPQFPSLSRQLLRAGLIAEEVVNELLVDMGANMRFDKNDKELGIISVLEEKNLAGIAREIIDSMVVLLGMAAEYGLPIPELWNEVHRTNMAKKGGPVRHDGKILKPPGWKPPDIKGILKKHGWREENARTERSEEE